MADFNKPEKTQLYESVLSSIRALFASVVGLLDSRDTDPDNKPVRAKRWDDANARFQSWESSAWLTKLLGVAGGGTGASTASGARTSLGVPSTTDLTNHTGATGTSVHGLGNASTATVSTGHTDVTAGRVLRAEDLPLVSQAEAEAGTDTTNRRWTPLRVKQAATAAVVQQVFHAQDQRASGIAGGTFPGFSWENRYLGVVLTNTITGASLYESTIILPAGTYYVEALLPAVGDTNHKGRLYNVSDSSVLAEGQNARGGASSIVVGWFTLLGTKTLLLQHRCGPNNGSFGSALASGSVEVYADVRIWKVSL